MEGDFGTPASSASHCVKAPGLNLPLAPAVKREVKNGAGDSELPCGKMACGHPKNAAAIQKIQCSETRSGPLKAGSRQ
jgi:hypothetical protein